MWADLLVLVAISLIVTICIGAIEAAGDVDWPQWTLLVRVVAICICALIGIGFDISVIATHTHSFPFKYVGEAFAASAITWGLLMASIAIGKYDDDAAIFGIVIGLFGFIWIIGGWIFLAALTGSNGGSQVAPGPPLPTTTVIINNSQNSNSGTNIINNNQGSDSGTSIWIPVEAIGTAVGGAAAVVSVIAARRKTT